MNQSTPTPPANLEQTAAVEVPHSALVHCPEREFKLTRVATCTSCPNFAGLTERFKDGHHSFAVRYSVGCSARPVQREIKELSE